MMADETTRTGVIGRPVAREGFPWRAALVSGIATGILGGTVMILILMITTAARGLGFWTPLQSLAATFLGVEALVGGTWTMLLGLAFHLAVASVLAFVYAALVGRTASFGGALLTGAAYGLAIYAFMSFFLLPMVNPVMAARVALLPVVWFFAHMAFGATLALAPLLKRRMRRPVRRGLEPSQA